LESDDETDERGDAAGMVWREKCQGLFEVVDDLVEVEQILGLVEACLERICEIYERRRAVWMTWRAKDECLLVDAYCLVQGLHRGVVLSAHKVT
jgi:hypothetical protein